MLVTVLGIDFQVPTSVPSVANRMSLAIRSGRAVQSVNILHCFTQILNTLYITLL